MKDKKIKVLFLLILLGVFALIVVLRLQENQVAQVFSQDKVTLSPEGSAVVVESMKQSDFDTYKGDIITGNKDGAKRINMSGKVIWDQPYTMISPQILIEDSYILIADIGGNEFYLFNNKGVVYGQKSNYPILLAEVTASGQAVIVEENRDAHIITVYDNEGKYTFKRNTSIDNGGYPMDVALSDNGGKMIVSYLDINDMEPKSNIVFFDLLDKSIYQLDRIRNAVGIDNELVSEVDYIGNDTYVIFSDKSIRGYTFTNKGEESFNISLTNKIADATSGNKYFAIAYGDPLVGNDVDRSNTIEIYDRKGNTIQNFHTDGPLTYMDMNEDQVIMATGRQYVCASIYGDVKWKYDAIVDVTQISTIDKNNVLVVWDGYYQVFKKFRLY